MDGLTAWMEKHILPVAAKIGAQKHLVASNNGRCGRRNDHCNYS